MYYNLLLFKFEVIIFFISLGYIIYYFSDKIFSGFLTLKKVLGFSKKQGEKNIATIQIDEDKNLHANTYVIQKDNISLDDKNKVVELLKRIKINISKGEYDVAKNLIIEGLTIDKFNIDLNIELAGIYILEKDYLKAEYIYKDLLLVHEEEFEVLKKLGYVLSMQEKYDLAIEIYKQANDIKDTDMEIINMLAHLYYYNNMYVDAIGQLKIFLKEFPKEVDNLILLAASYRNIGKILDSINTYKKALDIDPYNEGVKKQIQELEAIEYGNGEV